MPAVTAFGTFDLPSCCAKSAVFNVEFCAAVGTTPDVQLLTSFQLEPLPVVTIPAVTVIAYVSVASEQPPVPVTV